MTNETIPTIKANVSFRLLVGSKTFIFHSIILSYSRALFVCWDAVAAATASAACPGMPQQNQLPCTGVNKTCVELFLDDVDDDDEDCLYWVRTRHQASPSGLGVSFHAPQRETSRNGYGC